MTPPLEKAHRTILADYLSTLMAPWILARDPSLLRAPKEHVKLPYDQELERLISDCLAPLGHRLDGDIRWRGEAGDTGTMRVIANQIEMIEDEPPSLSEEGKENFRKEIMRLIQSRDPEQILEATDLFDQIAEANDFIVEAVNLLIPILDDSEVEARWRAAECLMCFGAQAEPAIPALIVGLSDSHEWVRSAAAATLGSIGPQAASAIPFLEKLKSDPSYGPAGRAQEALARIRNQEVV